IAAVLIAVIQFENQLTCRTVKIWPHRNRVIGRNYRISYWGCVHCLSDVLEHERWTSSNDRPLVEIVSTAPKGSWLGVVCRHVANSTKAGDTVLDGLRIQGRLD